MEETKSNNGTFCWIELATSDTAAAQKFYNKLFGWQPFEVPMGENQTYYMHQLDGKNAAGMYELKPEQVEYKIPPHWMPYVMVENVEDTLKKAGSIGGNVIMGPLEVPDAGVMGIITDPDGAFLAIWQPLNNEGTFLQYVFGGYCWAELGTRQKDKVEPFLNELFGWTSETKDMGGMIYTTFSKGEEMTCGMYTMPPELDGVPSNWLTYFMLEDIDKTIEMTKSEGGEIMMPKMFVPEVGHVAVLQDPQGAVFGVLQGVEQQ